MLTVCNGPHPECYSVPPETARAGAKNVGYSDRKVNALRHELTYGRRFHSFNLASVGLESMIDNSLHRRRCAETYGTHSCGVGAGPVVGIRVHGVLEAINDNTLGTIMRSRLLDDQVSISLILLRS